MERSRAGPLAATSLDLLCALIAMSPSCREVAAFKLVIDSNTMSPSDLHMAATGRLAANGSYLLRRCDVLPPPPCLCCSLPLLVVLVATWQVVTSQDTAFAASIKISM